MIKNIAKNCKDNTKYKMDDKFENESVDDDYVEIIKAKGNKEKTNYINKFFLAFN